ncbi:MAG TPA: hypothetical protein VFC06_03325, partial [Demequina sp.]|nr:hypothetical protein [Demequina sp.]
MTAEDPTPQPENPDVAAGTPADAADALDYVVLTTPEGHADGVVRCQRCGATEVEYSASKGNTALMMLLVEVVEWMST